MISFQDRAVPDRSYITLEQVNAEDEAAAALAEPHSHSFYEVMLVLRSRCEFLLPRNRVQLIPGDLLLIPPGQPHAYRLYKGAQICLCQFESNIISDTLASLLKDMVCWYTPQKNVMQKRVHDMQAFEAEPAGMESKKEIGLQGFIHLSRAEVGFIYPLFQNIQTEQQEQHFGFEQMKLAYLQELLILVKRAQLSQVEQPQAEASWKADMINAVLTQIDEKLAHEIDFDSIAHKQGITLSYFRMIFKDITGMTPTDYLNRVRVLRALEMLQTSDMPVSEIARKVGIYDANYFSRLFKKITGYPPRYYKSIPPEPKE